MKTINLKADKISAYTRKSDGRAMHLYVVTGDKESLALYKEEKGAYYKEDEQGRPFFQAPQDKFIGNSVNLRHAPNTNIKFFIDDSQFAEESAIMANRAKFMGASKEDVLGAMSKAMVSAPSNVGTQTEMFTEENTIIEDETTEDISSM